ncbi:MAG: DNA polymerase III subunit delta [Candidatus Competibacteraceae bacterium]|nr:DNA polymerase III subunit delta [Candidatus Competibacteraceae bacterium]
MKVRPEQLSAQLKRGLAPLYIIHGSEPLLILEAADAVRAAARERGFHERELFTVETGFDWSRVQLEANSGSLFASQRLLEIRLGDAKPGDSGGRVLSQLAAQPSPDMLVLLSAGKLDQSAQKSRWFKALDKVGVNVTVWPLDARQLPRWLEQRLRAHGLQPTAEALALLSSRCEGNLLAAKQEIDRLALLLEPGPVGIEQIMQLGSDQARYSIYDLADAALMGKTKRVIRIVQVLKHEGVEPILAVWALHREIQSLNRLRFDIQRGLTVPAALTRHNIWEKRKPLFTQALNRIDTPTCRQLLRACAKLDGLIKGAERGDVWDSLLALSLRLAGHNSLSDPLRTVSIEPHAYTQDA